jgi:hypothetical protein
LLENERNILSSSDSVTISEIVFSYCHNGYLKKSKKKDKQKISFECICVNAYDCKKIYTFSISVIMSIIMFSYYYDNFEKTMRKVTKNLI